MLDMFALQKGETAVHAAARHGHLAVLQFLAVHGQSLNPQNKSHETPLHLAARFGHVAIVEYLCSLEIDVNTQDKVRICWLSFVPIHFVQPLR